MNAALSTETPDVINCVIILSAGEGGMLKLLVCVSIQAPIPHKNGNLISSHYFFFSSRASTKIHITQYLFYS